MNWADKQKQFRKFDSVKSRIYYIHTEFPLSNLWKINLLKWIFDILFVISKNNWNDKKTSHLSLELFLHHLINHSWMLELLNWNEWQVFWKQFFPSMINMKYCCNEKLRLMNVMIWNNDLEYYFLKWRKYQGTYQA